MIWVKNSPVVENVQIKGEGSIYLTNVILI